MFKTCRANEYGFTDISEIILIGVIFMTPREPFADNCVNCIYASIDKDWNIYCEIYKAGIVPECGKENPNVQVNSSN